MIQVDEVAEKRELEAKVARIVRSRRAGVALGNEQWILVRCRERIAELKKQIEAKPRSS
jgi:hypothetical protein